jgi:hypothetical protein
VYLQKTGTAWLGRREQRMLSDLIRALPAVVLVGAVPGWFWAKLLHASADLYERIAYSVAISYPLRGREDHAIDARLALTSLGRSGAPSRRRLRSQEGVPDP